MDENRVRKTQARNVERERRRAQRERKEKLIWQIPLGAAALIALIVAMYFVFGAAVKPTPQVSAGSEGPHFQADTEKLDLGDEPLGKNVHASFDVKNTGDGTLTLNAAPVASVLEGC